jgi:hypothetical protein
MAFNNLIAALFNLLHFRSLFNLISLFWKKKKKRRLTRSPCCLCVHPCLSLSVYSPLIIFILHIIYRLYFAIIPHLLCHLGLSIFKHFPIVYICVHFVRILIFLSASSSFTVSHFLHRSCFITFLISKWPSNIWWDIFSSVALGKCRSIILN